MRSIRLGSLLVFAMIVTGCTIAKIRDDTPRNSGRLLGNYSSLARCTVAQLESDKRWSINTLDYNVRTYPDNQSSEITGSAVTTTITGVAFDLKIVQVDSEYVQVDIVGAKTESQIAWDYVVECSEKPIK